MRETKQGPASTVSEQGALRRKVDLLFIHPAKQGTETNALHHRMGNPYLFFPVGVIGLLNLLRNQGISVKGVNYPLELTLNEDFSLSQWLDRYVGVQLILIDLHWYEHSYGAIQTARLCRRHHPQAWILLGGLTASAYAKEILEHFQEIDLIIRGDAEWPLLDLMEKLANVPRGKRVDLAKVPNLTYRCRKEIVSNPTNYCASRRHMDTLNFIDLDFLEHQDEYYLRQFSGYLPLRGHWLCIGRGCTHSCPFCGGCYAAHKELARRKGFVLRSPERVVRDLQRLCRKGIDQGAFNLDIASLGNSYWAPLFHGMCEREVKIGIYNEFWGIPGKNFIEQMLRSVEISASRVAFSPLSGDETVRSLNGKDFKNEELLEILSLLQQRDMQVVIYFSLNLPGEDEETFENTLELAQKIYENYPSELLDILNMCHTLDPLSPMSTDPDRYGVQVNMTTFKDYYQYCYRTRRTGEDARSGKRRGFHLKERKRRSLKKMADSWDRAGQGRAPAWRPIPHTW